MQKDDRWLSIGEFAAATQLSLKALRLYDEHRLLAPGKIDSANSYRFYRRDQVAMGRLIRTLREMNVSLHDIGRFVRAPASSSALLNEFAKAVDNRYAREKRAYQAALMLLRQAEPARESPISKRQRPPLSVVAISCLTTRAGIFECVRNAASTLNSQLARHSISPSKTAFANIVDPLSDDEGRIEVSLPIDVAAPVSADIAIRRMPAVTYAAFDNADALNDLSAGQDVIFDWFDRHGFRAIETPWLVFEIDPLQVVELNWAFEPARP